MLSSVDCITTTTVSEFLVHTAGLFGDLRLSTLICWRRTKISASRHTLDWNSPMSVDRRNSPRARTTTTRRLLARRHAGMRYRGQSYEVPVSVPRLRGPDDLADLIRRFHDAHQRRYGHMAEIEAVEIVNFQVTAVGLIPKPALKTFDGPTAAATAEQTPHSTRQVYFSATDASNVPVLKRGVLPPGVCIEGPAIIEEKTSTVVLYPGQRAAVDGYLNIEIEQSS
jgi:N-methylhydantoinase A/oxoprolinase/acetone carboxylase beta subunit